MQELLGHTQHNTVEHEALDLGENTCDVQHVCLVANSRWPGLASWLLSSLGYSVSLVAKLMTIIVLMTVALVLPGCIDAPASSVLLTEESSEDVVTEFDTPTVAIETPVEEVTVEPLQPYDPRPDFQKYAEQDQIDQFSWDSFLYINWPAAIGQRGLPDSHKTLLDTGIVVWESWKSTPEVYVEPNEIPRPWDTPLPATRNFQINKQIDGQVLYDKQEPPQPTLYEIYMNEATFNYILQRGVYNRAGQQKFFNDPQAEPIDFPQDALEVKAVWRVLNSNDDQSRYHTAEGCYEDDSGSQQCGTMGLTGLHITSKVTPDWVWMTFEQVDNQITTQAPLTAEIPPAVQALNEQMHQQLKGTVWEYYILRGTQSEFVDEEGKATLLANTQIETYFQNSSSCITCHGLASVGAPADGRINFWNMSGGNVEGYVGELPEQLFENGKYKSVDFIWSLREAQ